MTHTRSTRVALLVFVAAVSTRALPGAQPPAQPAPDYNAYYHIGPDSLAHDGVPQGDVRGPFVVSSLAYPGTQHTYWVYVPAQYDPAIATSLMIFQDGQAFKDMDGVVRAPNVLDNLIYRREIPVMIAVFINPGRTPEQPEPTPAEWGDRTTNRPTEYNSLDDRYARVIVDELMPVRYKEPSVKLRTATLALGEAQEGAADVQVTPTDDQRQPRKTRKTRKRNDLFRDFRVFRAFRGEVLAARRAPHCLRASLFASDAFTT